MLHSRDKRIEENIKQALSRIFQREIRDPRVPAIFTITHVTVAKDLRHAKVMYSQLPDSEEALDQTEAMLRDCAGFVRSKIAKEVNLKFTPELHFEFDPGQQNYQRINTQLHKLKEKGELTDEPGPGSPEE